MFDEVFEQDEVYDDPEDWGEVGSAELGVDPSLQFYLEEAQELWEEEQYAAPGEDEFEPVVQMGIDAWPKFLFISTILACLLVAVILFLAPIDVSSSSPAASDSKQNTTRLESQVALPASRPGALAAQNAYVPADCRISNRFPVKIRQWCGLISEYADKHSLPPDLVAALILQESGGNSAAYSKSGAVGLMQVMPRDGLAASFMCPAGPCFADRPSSSQLQDPAFNISYGTRMLAGLVSKYGSLRDALKSYGPANVGYYYADIVMGLYQRYGNQ
jgi:hypothetical protein